MRIKRSAVPAPTLPEEHADDLPLFSAAEWEAWGVKNNADFMKLWDIAWRLSDMDGAEAAKNSKAPTSD